MISNVLRLGPRIACLPVIHGSGDFALLVRRVMLEEAFDCVAVPLPPSFQADVERGIDQLPSPTIVTQPEMTRFDTEWSPERDNDADFDLESDDASDSEEPTHSFVPIDPCQPVIAALRAAVSEHIPRAFIDLETAHFVPNTAVLPDAYALKKVSLEQFAAAVLPALERPQHPQLISRIAHMAARLRQLERRYKSILFVCSILDWPWIREAYVENHPASAEDDFVEETTLYQPDERTLLFLLGELPFITGLYERARSELEDDENLSIDGVKELLITARQRYKRDLARRARKITPQILRQCLKYIRNLTLFERRFTPDLYSIVTAAKQTAGDQYALHVAETAREYQSGPGYPPRGSAPRVDKWSSNVHGNSRSELPTLTLGIGRGRLPDGETVRLVSRLPGPPLVWRGLQLQRRPDRRERDEWRMRWNPFSQCSWPPEDQLIEDFRAHVFDRARAVMGADLARTEPFTTSILDGIDIRDTLRHWYEEKIYVKVLPPSRGKLDCVVMLFDSPADPREYPWRTTWYAEHANESTLAFFATDFSKELVGPGIALATYGGCLFLFPPVHIPEIWRDETLDFAETLEERLLAAACAYSACPHIALMSTAPPGAGWRRLAKRYGKKWVHLPLSQFSDATIQQLRMVHVLNGREVRSYAAEFIRKA
jgi:hypothetical protein